MPSTHEQRLQLRFALTEDEGFTGLLDDRRSGAHAETLVHDLSLGGAGLVVPTPKILRGHRSLLLELHHAARPLGEIPVDLVHLQQLADGGQLRHVVGVRFRSQSEPFLRDLCRYLVERCSRPPDQPRFLADPGAFSETRDPRRVRQLLVHCCRRRIGLQVFDAAAGRPLARFVPKALRQDRIVGSLSKIGSRAVPVGGQCYLALSSFTGLHVLLVTLLGADGQQVAFSLPRRMVEGGIRRAGRLRPEDDFPVWLEFLHPQLPGKLVRKLADEVGLDGIRFRLNVDEDLLAPGTVIESAALRLPGGHSVACRGVVRHTCRDATGYACGLELLGFAGNGRQDWVTEVLGRLNPSVQEATPFGLDEVWEVFERSGYLEEKPAEVMQAMRRPFISAWQRLLARRDGSRCWLCREQERSIGTICASRIYSNTWLVHHLAVDRALGAARKLLVVADLFPRTAFQWLAGVEPGGKVMGYFDATRAFNQQAWVQFLSSYQGSGRKDLQQVAIRDFQLDGLSPPAPQQPIWVRNASEAEQAQVSEHLLERDGPFLHEALDYRPEALGLRHTGLAGLDRERTVIVAGQRDHFLGYLLLETAARGVNIFSLYDTCRIVLLEPAHVLAARVRDALLARAMAVLQAAGVSRLLYLQGDQDPPPPDWGGYLDLRAVRTVFDAEVIPQWVAYLNDLWVHR
jgi:hypothetical protein